MNDASVVINSLNHLRSRGWMPGSSGALCLVCDITENSRKIYVTPEQMAKKITPNDLFLLRSLYGEQELQEPLNQIDETLTISRWTATFIELIMRKPEVKAIVQVSTKWSVIAARMALDAWRKRSESHPNILRLAHWELLKDLSGSKELQIPIINLSDSETMLTEIKSLLSTHSETCAILVRDYGMVVWGDSFDQIERRVEILEHVCEMQIYSYTLLSPPSFV